MTDTATNLEKRTLANGQIAVLEIGPAPANIVDRALMSSLGDALTAVADDMSVKLVIITGAGDHFCYGASVEEHTPDQVGAMLPEFHAFLRKIDELNLPPVLAAVNGRCFGGGFEVALACDLIAVSEGSLLGCPEIKLGVFPPAGSALLPLRVPAGRAAAMLMSGAMVSSQEAAGLGIADLEIPEGGLLKGVESWAEHAILEQSASSLRQARRASRWPWTDALTRILPKLEEQYLNDLMATNDAKEGIQAFLDKRPPNWSNS
ncbi:MAG: cyclohexa-1,5-dienecarbonyl-CoA hydratase [Planctomycetes bacterium]|jgi:cyclohexa-1,5-dienecarbonyl-CoA hydratase|nr:cyclohexa-1,5-dienecarbonyl-CoA hydratase [Planctomycetota bacterium]MBT4029244.1 cyclohexa-1,5-dienecarbonyl-CoA hydratase [Planctomycetota bacterium]MBT4560289.1 cyclohexa-1,5-dienecarbonyl-CoA hydratase [Planctomycetota bacterium]MBT5100389.1 cyclohexa-1,5-dienecarbonyl-CoA hydratase [Planctomycetota bacterium]MBT5119567.1 cyclohexa-1,5-dienecarbonyl-CoA hydratase [Planctomycetota bacterium]